MYKVHSIQSMEKHRTDAPNAARIYGYGTTLFLDQVPMPEIGADEVLVRVCAASLNPLDVKLHSGAMQDYFPLNFPYTLGTDLSGTIDRVGALVTRWKQGDRVVARLDPTQGGALADFAVVPAAYLAPAPTKVGLDVAAGAPTAAGTAWQSLFEIANLQRGQTVLVHAGAGGVGSFAIQLARLAGAHVIATASGLGIELAQQLGADQVIDYRLDDFSERLSNVDIVLDTIGGETQQRSLKVLRPGGTLVATSSPPDETLAKANNIVASFVFHQSNATRLGMVLGLLEAGMLRVLVDRNVPFASLNDAFQHQSSGQAKGKIIIRMN